LDSKNRYWLGRHESKGAILVKRPVSGSPRIDVWFYEQRRWVDCNREIMRSKVFDDLSSDFVKEAESALIKKENIELELKHEAHLQKHGLSSAGTKKERQQAQLASHIAGHASRILIASVFSNVLAAVGFSAIAVLAAVGVSSLFIPNISSQPTAHGGG